MNSMEAPNPLPVSNMIYGWNFVALFVVIIGIVMMLFCVADLLLDSDLFSSLKLPAPQVTAGFAFKSKGWWICAAILALIPVLFFFPVQRSATRWLLINCSSWVLPPMAF